MSEKRLDARNRWRNVVVAFRMSPEEAQELNVKVALSGLSKQNYIIQCLLKHEIRGGWRNESGKKSKNSSLIRFSMNCSRLTIQTGMWTLRNFWFR